MFLLTNITKILTLVYDNTLIGAVSGGTIVWHQLHKYVLNNCMFKVVADGTQQRPN